MTNTPQVKLDDFPPKFETQLKVGTFSNSQDDLFLNKMSGKIYLEYSKMGRKSCEFQIQLGSLVYFQWPTKNTCDCEKLPTCLLLYVCTILFNGICQFV